MCVHAIRGTYIEQLSDDAIDVILTRFAAPPPACGFGFDLDHYVHGQVCRIAPDATAFELRADALARTGGSRDQNQSRQDADDPAGAHDAHTGRCEMLGRDGCRRESHHAEIHDPHDQDN